MHWRHAASASTVLVGTALMALSAVTPVAAAPDGPLPVAADMVLAPQPAGDVLAADARWPGSTITVRNTLKGLKRIAAKRAIREWNTAGLNITFKPVKSASAQVVIREVSPKKMPCAGSGCGTLGYPGSGAKGYVTLTNRLDPEHDTSFDAAWYAQLVAHELGHILGLSHSGTSTALMYPYPHSMTIDDIGRCRFRAKEDVRRAQQLYGGKGSLKLRTQCRFRPAATSVPSISVATDGTVVSVSWGKAARAAGYTVRRGPAGGACPANPRAGLFLQVAGRKAEDYGAVEGKKYCYRVFPYNAENFYNLKGAKSTVFTVVTPRPDRPTGITLTRNDAGLDEGWVGFDARGVSPEQEIWFAAATGNTCPVAADDFSPLYPQPDDGYPDIVLDAIGSTRCIAFRQVAYDFNGNMLWSPSYEVRVSG